MGLIVGEPKVVGTDNGKLVKLPVELRVSSGFATPARHTRGTVAITLRGKVDGAITAEVRIDTEPVEGES